MPITRQQRVAAIKQAASEGLSGGKQNLRVAELLKAPQSVAAPRKKTSTDLIFQNPQQAADRNAAAAAARKTRTGSIEGASSPTPVAAPIAVPVAAPVAAPAAVISPETGLALPSPNDPGLSVVEISLRRRKINQANAIRSRESASAARAAQNNAIRARHAAEAAARSGQAAPVAAPVAAPTPAATPAPATAAVAAATPEQTAPQTATQTSNMSEQQLVREAVKLGLTGLAANVFASIAQGKEATLSPNLSPDIIQRAKAAVQQFQSGQKPTDAAVTAAPVPLTPTQEAAQFFNASADSLLEGIKLGALKPDPNDPVWTSLYQDGKPTEAQVRAWGMWQSRTKFGQMSAVELLDQIKSGAVTPSRENNNWRALYDNGQPTNAQVEAYQLWEDFNIENQINGEQKFMQDLMTSADTSANANIRNETKVTNAIDRITDTNKPAKDKAADLALSLTSPDLTTSTGEQINIFGNTAQTGALQLYRDLMLNNTTINSISSDISGVQTELDKVSAAELAMENDIRREVEGEAPASYIQALAARRAQDIYPKKFALNSQLGRLKTQLSDEKQHIANVMKFALQDENTRYQRNFDALKLTLQQQASAQASEIQLQKFLLDLPKDRSFTLNGQTYKGAGKSANLQTYQFTDSSGKVWIIGKDTSTGEELYRSFIGQGKVSGTGTGQVSPSKELKNLLAQKSLDTLKGIDSGKFVAFRPANVNDKAVADVVLDSAVVRARADALQAAEANDFLQFNNLTPEEAIAKAKQQLVDEGSIIAEL